MMATNKNKSTKAGASVANKNPDPIKRMGSDMKLNINYPKTPSPKEIKTARLDAGQTQSEAAHTIFSNMAVWQSWEWGTRKMHPAFYAYYLYKTAGFNLKDVNGDPLPRPKQIEKEDNPGSPSKEEVIAARLLAGHNQKEAAEVIHSTLSTWQKWEYDQRKMHPALFALYRLKTMDNRERKSVILSPKKVIQVKKK